MRVPEAHTLEAHTLEAHTLEAHTLEAHTLEAHTLEAHTLEAHTLEAHTLEAHMQAPPPGTGPDGGACSVLGTRRQMMLRPRKGTSAQRCIGRADGAA
jgi:hypothetical protein